MSGGGAPKSEIILYQTEDGRTRIEVHFDRETVWLTQAQMAELFQTTRQNVGQHIQNIFDEGELQQEATIKDLFIVQAKVFTHTATCHCRQGSFQLGWSSGGCRMESRTSEVPADKVILRVLQETQNHHARPVYRTALVKLVYLVDYMYAQHTGHTLTGLQYIWDDYGPNAAGNQIVKRADLLQSQTGAIHIEQSQTPSGNPRYQYRLTGVAAGAVDELGEQIIRDVTTTYGGLNWSAIVKAAKSTRPMLTANPGDSVDLAPDPEKQRRLAKITAEIRQRKYEADRGGVSIAELKTRYGLSN